jgi:acyl-CoA carboxylase epsilon subunit
VTDTSSPNAPAVLRVVKGHPGARELAALVAVLAARSSAAQAAGSPTPSLWSAPARRVREPLRVGPTGWRGAAAPR